MHQIHIGAERLLEVNPPRRLRGVVILLAALSVACSHSMMPDLGPPPPSEFGFGPRPSMTGVYEVTIVPAEPIRVGSMHVWNLEVRYAGGGAVEGAAITVDGGMPQHGHGLPTSPRVTGEPHPGMYRVEGMRFNMGGWWVVDFQIVTGTETDTVRFHLSL